MVLELQIECSRDNVDEISALLEETEAASITLTDKYDDPILEPEIGTTPLWSHIIVNALYTEESDAKAALKHLESVHPNITTSLKPVKEQDWERVWMDNYQPICFGTRLWVCPSWMSPPSPEACNLILDPGLAFGTGTHPTTSLCLGWLDKTRLDNQTIIDYGCGSGILALAALKLGAKHAYAVDIDEQALLATQNNAKPNDITQQQLTISSPDKLQTDVDILLANILLSPLLQLKSQFFQLVKEGGFVVVSGILVEQVPDVIEAYQHESFTHQTTETQGDWALLVFQK